MISNAATRLRPVTSGMSAWQMTAIRLLESWTRTCSCCCGGNASTMRLMVVSAELVCSVAKTRWPVSAALMAVSIVSRSRISPTRITSGFCRRARRRPSAKVGTSTPSSRCVTTERLWVWKYSIGSSTVMMCVSRFDVDVVNHRRERGRLARAGGPGDEDQAAGAPEQPLDVLAQADLLEGQELVRDQPQDDAGVAALLEDGDAEAGLRRRRRSRSPWSRPPGVPAGSARR